MWTQLGGPKWSLKETEYFQSDLLWLLHLNLDSKTWNDYIWDSLQLLNGWDNSQWINAKVKIFCGVWKCPILFANSITGVYYLQTTWHILRVDFIQFWDSASCRNTEVNSASILPVGSFNFEVLWSSSLQHHKKCKGLGFNVQSVLITYPSGFNVLSVLLNNLRCCNYEM